MVSLRKGSASLSRDLASLFLYSAVYISILTDRKISFIALFTILGLSYKMSMKAKLRWDQVLSFLLDLSTVFIFVTYLGYVIFRIGITIRESELQSQNIVFVSVVLAVYHILLAPKLQRKTVLKNSICGPISEKPISNGSTSANGTYSSNRRKTISLSLSDSHSRISNACHRVSVMVGNTVRLRGGSISISKVLNVNSDYTSKFSSRSIWFGRIKRFVYICFFTFTSFYISLLIIVGISAWYIGDDGFTMKEVSVFYKDKVVSRLPLCVESHFNKFNLLVAVVCLLTALKKAFEKW